MRSLVAVGAFDSNSKFGSHTANDVQLRFEVEVGSFVWYSRPGTHTLSSWQWRSLVCVGETDSNSFARHVVSDEQFAFLATAHAAA
jgi:hypothetical protein